MPRSVSYQSVVDKYKYRTPIYRIVASVLCCFTFYVVVGHRPYSIYTLMFIRFQRKIIDDKWNSFLFQHFSMGYNNIKTHGSITKRNWIIDRPGFEPWPKINWREGNGGDTCESKPALVPLPKTLVPSYQNEVRSQVTFPLNKPHWLEWK